jgi:hypothetical protein
VDHFNFTDNRRSIGRDEKLAQVIDQEFVAAYVGISTKSKMIQTYNTHRLGRNLS